MVNTINDIRVIERKDISPSMTHILREDNICWVIEWFENQEYCCFYQLELGHSEDTENNWYSFHNVEEGTYRDEWLEIAHPFSCYHPLAFAENEDMTQEEWEIAIKDPKISLTLHII
jgi:hypothetical protein